MKIDNGIKYFSDGSKFRIINGEICHNRSFKDEKDFTHADRVIHKVPLNYTCYWNLITEKHRITTYHIPKEVKKLDSTISEITNFIFKENPKVKLKKTKKRKKNKKAILDKKEKKVINKRKKKIKENKKHQKIINTLPLDCESWDDYYNLKDDILECDNDDNYTSDCDFNYSYYDDDFYYDSDFYY